MFSVELQSLDCDQGLSFPLFIRLERNDKFIPIRLIGDPLGKYKHKFLLQKNVSSLWVPREYLESFKIYSQFISESKSRASRDQEESGEDIFKKVNSDSEKNEKPVRSPRRQKKTSDSEEAALVYDVITDEELTQEEKAKILSAVSQDMLRAINQITDRGEEARAEGIKSSRKIVDEILEIASANSNIYEEILALWNSQEDIDHSVMTGTISVMFGLALGYNDESLLADLTVAAIFHDIGLVKVDPTVMAKEERDWTKSDKSEYKLHVQLGIDLLKESGGEFHPRVFRMITEHHENYDGSGFPMGLKGSKIEDTSQILHLANLFDRICVGKHTGMPMSPAEAFDLIYGGIRLPNAIQEVQPELIERIFQFMATEKMAVEEIRANTVKVANSLMETKGKA